MPQQTCNVFEWSPEKLRYFTWNFIFSMKLIEVNHSNTPYHAICRTTYKGNKRSLDKTFFSYFPRRKRFIDH